ncbi:RNA-directed DNA polymerase [Paenibacillus lautus]|uniref:RNA-directed DNA polymerase n=1 Tax=Paenibacillus lautus TaxID=1401 RepID=UPI001C11BBF5|nr:RNA-directed DNA polymerase [Paenibacillus lautus]MBU5347916.1 RNA-directed DNA polymerase [Paenibacillus lautus]
MVTLKDFIGRGYFPEDIVSPFTTTSFADNLVNIPITTFESKKNTSKCGTHTIPKVKHQRRIRSIPNPLHYLLYCNDIVNHWDEIKNILNISKISLSKPVIGTKRALEKEINYTDIREKRALASATSRYFLYTDISRYYPTIYTHSIPWAIHGKDVAKRNRKHELYGNLLDTRQRNLQDGQTMGIPLGTDTSFLIGEIIGTRIDQYLVDKVPDINGFRYVDDFYFYFNSLSEAERCLSYLHSVMKDYELELNPNKTQITELPDSLESNWVSELRLHQFHRSAIRQHTDLLSYFSKAFDYSKKCPNDSVLKYAITAIEEIYIYEDNWSLYESLLLQSIIVEPSVLPRVLEILYTYKEKGYSLDTNKIQEAVTQIIIYHTQYNNGFEIAWAMWLSNVLSIPLTDKAANFVSSIDDTVVALSALHLNDKALIPNGLDLSYWNSLMKAENLYTQHWLLAYEAMRKGWLRTVSGRDYTQNDDFFSLLSDNNVSFYDNNFTVNTIEITDPDINVEETFGRKMDY